jgi:hypothetical protein
MFEQTEMMTEVVNISLLVKEKEREKERDTHTHTQIYKEEKER